MTAEPRRCGARTRSGEPCQAMPVAGATRCRMHGGTSPASRAKVARDRAKAEAVAAVELFGGRRDIDPATALMELTQRKAAECEFWRARVHQIQQGDEAALTFGLVREKTGVGDDGVEITREARAHVALSLLHAAERDLANYAAASLKAGVDESMVAIAEKTAAEFRRVVEAVLADPRLGVTADDDTRTAVIVDALRGSIAGDPMRPELN